MLNANAITSRSVRRVAKAERYKVPGSVCAKSHFRRPDDVRAHDSSAEWVYIHPCARGGNRMQSKTKMATALLAALSCAAVVWGQAADEPAADTFVSLKLEGDCDAKNKRLWITNTHTYKTIATTVKWRAAGGKDLIDQFYPGPNTVREIGCAAEGEILDARYAEF